MSWLISHKPSNTNIVFDLGIRQDTHNYPPALYERMQRLVRAEIPQEVFSSLQEANINPDSDIDTVIFSHLHYDHTGDPSRLGPGTKLIIGPGAKRFICVNAPGHPSGHLNLLVRAGLDERVYLTWDTTHDCAILAGMAHTAVYEDERTGIAKCAHEDKHISEEHISLARTLKESFHVEVILAHDSEWLAKNDSRFRG
ncbi:hypothetical protein BDV27DRAFT_157561 [Aspergillus caelatus]|uniref:Beta-lactamase-like protein n=1 Tax=Aspergillus caelatus TaxID=61420 RepID=A0A5N7A6I5_9EURO|nr:uncharacterized protein BDV27DRAFT_157561 [Aspergillus caelatus]KAE8364709.1 hypothetical protein BDV27DRAFT_157561 [Aspergillus caelatus]